MDRFIAVIKRSGWVLLQTAILLALVCGHLWLMYTNFTALKVSFELAKYDGTPVGDDLLTGLFWESFGLYELTQSHMFAAGIAFFVGVGSWIAFHYLYRTVRLLMDRREYERVGNNAMVELSNMAIIRNLVMFGIVMTFLIPVAAWDMQLFRFRSAAPVLGMEDNAIAMKDWSLLMEQHGDLFVMSLARLGGWAYIFLVCLASLAVELWVNYVQEALAKLGTDFMAWVEYINGTAADNAAAVNQTAPQPEGTDRAYADPASSTNAEQTGTNTNNTEQQRATADGAGTGNGNIEWPEKETVDPIYTTNTSGSQDNEEEVMVYGGSPGEKIKFSVATADPENYYIDEMRRVWKRSFSSGVHDEEPAAATA